MSRLTPEERRRVFLAQDKARRAMLTCLAEAPTIPEISLVSRRKRLWLSMTGMIITLLAGGWFAYRTMEFQAVEFHPPASIVEALLPRL